MLWHATVPPRDHPFRSLLHAGVMTAAADRWPGRIPRSSRPTQAWAPEGRSCRNTVLRPGPDRNRCGRIHSIFATKITGRHQDRARHLIDQRKPGRMRTASQRSVATAVAFATERRQAGTRGLSPHRRERIDGGDGREMPGNSSGGGSGALPPMTCDQQQRTAPHPGTAGHRDRPGEPAPGDDGLGDAVLPSAR